MKKTISFNELVTMPWIALNPEEITFVVNVTDFNNNIIECLSKALSRKVQMPVQDVIQYWTERERRTHHILNLVIESDLFDLCTVNGTLYYAGSCDSLREYLDDIEISKFHPDKLLAFIDADSLYGVPEIEITCLGED